MQARLPRRATYTDLEHTPENMVAEMIDGELFLRPRPASTASVSAAARVPPFEALALDLDRWWA